MRQPTPSVSRSGVRFFRFGDSAAKLLTRDEARRIAANIAKLTPSDVGVIVGIISLLVARRK